MLVFFNKMDVFGDYGNYDFFVIIYVYVFNIVYI